MNEKLKQEIGRYLSEECSHDDEPTVSEIAEHFYNLALEEVRKEVKMKYDCIDDIVTDWDDGYETACKEILNFIDNLTK